LFGAERSVAALKLICPRNTAIPRHALKQALAVMVGPSS
jgi:hypothetical protein